MNRSRPRAACFVAMPFGDKTPPGKSSPVIHFDDVHTHIERAVSAAGLEPMRADFEVGGGFIHKPMYERLLIAEYVIADLTFANPNVTYEVGVRHGASSRPTILIGADGYLADLPFDFRPLRVMPYVLTESGSMDPAAGAALEEGLGERLRRAIAGEAEVDNPILQVTGWQTGGWLEHDKTDVFMGRVAYASDIGERIEAALRLSDTEAAIAELEQIEDALVDDGEVVAELHSALLGVYLGYRDRKAYRQMVDMYPGLPSELRATPVAIEQYALALNRLAEAADVEGRAHELRSSALAAIDELDQALVTSETWGIRGRIYKGWYDDEAANGNSVRSEAMLARAIESYEGGVHADLRDYYPGINAVTLRLVRGSPDDLDALDDLLPVVRMAADTAPPARSTEERYWRAATQLELASAAKDWSAARRHLIEAVGVDAFDWMHETTIKNLEIHRRAFADDADAVAAVDELIDGLRA